MNLFLSDNSKSVIRILLRGKSCNTMFPGYHVGEPVTVSEDVILKILSECSHSGHAPVMEQIESIQFSNGIITERSSKNAYNTNYMEKTLDALFDSNSGLSVLTFERMGVSTDVLPSSSKCISSHIVFTRATVDFGKVQLILTGTGEEDSLRWLVSCEAAKGCRYADLSKALNIMFRTESEQKHPSCTDQWT